MIKAILFFIYFFSIQLFSQSLFVNIGENYTKFHYKDSFNNSIPNFQVSKGGFYEFGVEFQIKNDSLNSKQIFSYEVSLNLNQFNGKGGDFNNDYYWTTNYLGLRNSIKARIFHFPNKRLNVNLKFGFNSSTIIQGKQVLNNSVYNIKNHNEFKGFLFQPIVGVDLKIKLYEDLNFNLGYYYSKAYNLTNSSSEKLDFMNNQVTFGINWNVLKSISNLNKLY